LYAIQAAKHQIQLTENILKEKVHAATAAAKPAA
jgi:hypothetical protein